MNEYIPEFSMLVLQVLPHERKLVRTNKMENLFVLIEDEIFNIIISLFSTWTSHFQLLQKRLNEMKIQSWPLVGKSPLKGFFV